MEFNVFNVAPTTAIGIKADNGIEGVVKELKERENLLHGFLVYGSQVWGWSREIWVYYFKDDSEKGIENAKNSYPLTSKVFTKKY